METTIPAMASMPQWIQLGLLIQHDELIRSMGEGDLARASEGKTGFECMIFAPVSILGFDDGARKFRSGLAEAHVEAPGLSAVPTPGAFRDWIGACAGKL